MKWIEPSIDVAYYVGENLRVEDCKEVALSHGIAPTDAVVHSFLDSQKAAPLRQSWESHVGWLVLSATRFGCWRQRKPRLAVMPAGNCLRRVENGGRMYQRGRALA